MENKKINIAVEINAPLALVWNSYNNPEDIMQWNQASPDWHCPASENDLRIGGKFKNTMAAKDGSFAFDFEGTYTEITPHDSISYVLGDDRTVAIQFITENGKTSMAIAFEPESQNPEEMQKQGWQAILDSFKKHVESKS